ncbi:thiolase domain-containing protein, partial [Gammaproteobacteria bacterium]|nr:thiolase domain-containing protein [Gammaproteobacteria bacterium]
MIQAGVIGVGQTNYDSKRRDVSMAGLVREAIDKAMLAADIEWDAVDAVVLGKAPDMFEGVIMPELYLADAIGAVGKPVLRVHTAGSVGGSTAVIAASHVCSGQFKTVLTVTFE